MVVDTPGFDDDTEGVTDADTLHKIAKMLTLQYDLKMRLKGIIYLQRISDNRIGHSGKRALRVLREICGDPALENVILTTTRWGENRDGHDEERETYLLEHVWDPLLRMRAGKQRYHGTPDSAIGIVQDLLGHGEVVLDIQKEIVEEGRALGKTSAGTLVTDNLEELQAELEKRLHEIDRLRRELSNNDEAGRIRTDKQFANEQERMNQAKAAEKLLEEKLREKIREEIEEKIRAEIEAELKEQLAKRSRSEKAQAGARIAISIISAAVSIILGIFGLDPSLAEAVRSWFT
jgi:hypothetical protein